MVYLEMTSILESFLLAQFLCEFKVTNMRTKATVVVGIKPLLLAKRNENRAPS